MNKMGVKILQHLGVAISVSVLAYFFGAFVAADFNIINWGAESRAAVAIAWATVVFCVTPFIWVGRP